MTRFDTHLCLVSAQAAPNLEPAMNADLKPRRMVLAVSPDMQNQANWLESVLKSNGVVVERLPVADPYDYNACYEIFFNWLEQQTGNIALNVTGGTKLMAMAAMEVFRDASRPVFYINAENDELLRLDERQSPIALPTKIKLKDYLAAHGFSVQGKPQRPQISGETRDLINRLACDSERLGKALGRLNWFAMKAKGSLESPQLEVWDLRNEGLNGLISEFSSAGFLKQNGNRIKFSDESARSFVNGGWLELLIYQVLSELAPDPLLGIADHTIGLEVVAPDGTTRNELDAACLCRNTLHIIECKSANLDSSGKGEESSGADALYKIDGLRRMGGLRTRALLVDYRGSLRDVDKARAAQMNIDVISGSKLRDVKGALKAWLK